MEPQPLIKEKIFRIRDKRGNPIGLGCEAASIKSALDGLKQTDRTIYDDIRYHFLNKIEEKDYLWLCTKIGELVNNKDKWFEAFKEPEASR